MEILIEQSQLVSAFDKLMKKHEKTRNKCVGFK